jgi:Zn-dependent M28 family amino/carboxypeptidase
VSRPSSTDPAEAEHKIVTVPLRVRAQIAIRRRRLTSPNLIAKLGGSDCRMWSDYVVVSAHLDHVGIGPAVNGDPIYNGALDDGSGVETLLDIAQRLASFPRPRRSVLFLFATAEEPGLLGSIYFVKRPTVPGHAIVAGVNFDTLLPLWPLTSVLALGDGESALGGTA